MKLLLKLILALLAGSFLSSVVTLVVVRHLTKSEVDLSAALLVMAQEINQRIRLRHGKENDPRTIKDFPNAPATPNCGPSNTGESDTLESFAYQNQKYAQKLLFQKCLSRSLRLKQ